VPSCSTLVVLLIVALPVLASALAVAFVLPTSTLWPDVNHDADHSKDKVVQFIDWLLGCWQTVLNMPWYAIPAHVAKRVNGGNPWVYFNYVYLAFWILVTGLSAGLAVPSADGPWELVILSVVLWRAAEIFTWYLKLLFDKGHRVLLEVERNLLFLIIDSLAFVTVLAMMLEAEGTGMRAAWPQALSAFMLNGAPEDSRAWGTAVGIVGALAGVTLLGAGLGLIIGAIGDRLRKADEQALTSDKADEASEYTGPTRPPPPWDTPRPG
jgi:hypothetical protein